MHEKTEQFISYQVDSGVACIRLSRERTRNAFNSQMRAELLQALQTAEADQQVRVIVLSGSPAVFSSGQDLAEGVGAGQQTIDLLTEQYAPIITAIEHNKKIVIAAVDGACAGIGVAIALACDFVVMSEDAYFYLAFIAIGIIPDGGASWLLVRQLGYRRALELTLSGEKLSAREALRDGLCNRVCSEGDALAEAKRWAAALCEKAPLAVSYSKQVLKLAQNASFAQSYQHEAIVQGVLTASEDAKEGIQAFLARRKPSFVGR